jgi:hypothetical protein
MSGRAHVRERRKTVATITVTNCQDSCIVWHLKSKFFMCCRAGVLFVRVAVVQLFDGRDLMRLQPCRKVCAVAVLCVCRGCLGHDCCAQLEQSRDVQVVPLWC